MSSNENKVRLLRVVTQAEVVPWHLKNFIERSENDYELFVTGNNVSRFKKEYPYVTFIDNKILRKTSIFYDFKALIVLIFICIKVRPTIVHSIMPKSGFLTSIAGYITFCPIRIHTFTGQVWATKKGGIRKFYKSIDKLIFRLSTVCLTDSPSQSNFLYENGFHIDGKPIQNLGKGSLSGVDLKKFDINIIKDRNLLRSDLGIKNNDFVYLFLARKSIVKGIVELIESFAKITHFPNVKLLFIGPDESEGYLDELFEKHKKIESKIISLDIVENHEKYIAASDVLCLPSSSEGFGTIVIEAAALGIPCVGFDIVGLSDSIEHDYSGILVPFKDINKFSVEMTNLYQNSKKLNEMKLNARSRVLKYFSADVIYSLHDKFYKSLL
ncbi:glycosyltransferase family 1 protein [Tenacibaculum sp. Bg11-29]|uniref:glycosyltransferase n=1 Tax=Tenacibaculum sp. Bg11-29 TaxID=2058306 RepID=UPI000C34772B|nr:glycosyltransferase [Tenacibaculum sp. Bg11-29]PKH50432.1 glycosyltransferase family 1 protein [Tenacibaculum sp. Bg11-29]